MASAVGELRYYSGRAVSGSLAYDLDRELRERELSHAGEMPRHREQVREQPKVRRVAKVQVRQAQKVSAVTVVGSIHTGFDELYSADGAFCRNRGTAK